MYYYLLYKNQADSLRQQCCTECELIFHLQVFCFPYKFMLWSFIFFIMFCYTIVITITSVQNFNDICTQPIQVQMIVQAILITIKLFVYIMLFRTWHRMYPYVREHMKCIQECVHYFLRVKEFTLQNKCLVAFNLILNVIIVIWTVLGVSYGAKEQQLNAICFINGLTTQNLEISGLIFPLLFIETMAYLVEMCSYQIIIKNNKDYVNQYKKDRDQFNLKESYHPAGIQMSIPQNPPNNQQQQDSKQYQYPQQQQNHQQFQNSQNQSINTTLPNSNQMQHINMATSQQFNKQKQNYNPTDPYKIKSYTYEQS